VKQALCPAKAKLLNVDEPLTENLDVSTSQLTGFTYQETYCLVVMSGPDKGAVHNVSPGQTSLGRSERTDTPVSGKGISRIHAYLTVSPDGSVTLEDNGSTNGVFLNGRRISKAGLRPGDVFGLGPELKIRLESTDGGLHDLIKDMYHSSKIDALTNLLNRRAFEERMDEEFSVTKRHGHSSCLAILDIDHFKSINDTYGHDAGDEVLRHLSGVLKDKVRTGDLVARWGGEEFVIYVRQSDLNGAKILLDRIREFIAETEIPLPETDPLRITFSAGLVSLEHVLDWRNALTRADEALYQSKEGGRNKVTEVDLSDNA